MQFAHIVDMVEPQNSVNQHGEIEPAPLMVIEDFIDKLLFSITIFAYLFLRR
jgi:hypothetical protein